MNRYRISMKTILRPDFERNVKGSRIPRTPERTDYIDVPRLSTYGTWPIAECMPIESLVRLSIAVDRMNGVVRRGKPLAKTAGKPRK